MPTCICNFHVQSWEHFGARNILEKLKTTHDNKYTDLNILQCDAVSHNICNNIQYKPPLRLQTHGNQTLSLMSNGYFHLLQRRSTQYLTLLIMSHVYFGRTRWWSICCKAWRKAHMHKLKRVWSESDIRNWACCKVQSNARLSHSHQVQVWGLVCLYRTHTNQWVKVAAIQCSVTNSSQLPYKTMCIWQDRLTSNLKEQIFDR